MTNKEKALYTYKLLQEHREKKRREAALIRDYHSDSFNRCLNRYRKSQRIT